MFKKSILITLALVMSRGSIVVVGIVLANKLGASAFTVFAFVHMTSTMLSTISAFGMQNAVPRFFARVGLRGYQNTISEIAIATIMSSIGFILSSLLLIFLTSAFFGAISHEYLNAVIFLVCLVGFDNLLIGAANGMEKYFVLLKAAAFKSGILLLSAFVAVNTQSMHTIVYGYAAAVTVSIVLILGSILAPLRQELNIKRLELNRNQFWLVATFAAPLFVNSILTNSGIWFTGRSVLTKLNGTQMYAEIALGLQWYGLAALASGVIARVVVPIVTRSAFQDDKSTAKSSIQLGLFMSTGSAAFVFCIVLLFSEQILALYGSELQGAKAVLLMFVGAAVMSSCIEVVSSALVGRGLQLIVTYIIVSWWISLLGLLFLLSKYGSIGVSIAFLASYMVYFICGVIAGQKYSVLSEFS